MDKPIHIATNLDWYSAEATHPGSSGYYCTYSIKSCSVMRLEYSAKHNVWNASDKEDVPEFPVKVDYWAHMPEIFVKMTEDFYNGQD